MRTYSMYCECVFDTLIASHFLERVTQNDIETITLKSNFKLKIELITKTHTNIVIKYRFEILANCD